MSGAATPDQPVPEPPADEPADEGGPDDAGVFAVVAVVVVVLLAAAGLAAGFGGGGDSRMATRHAAPTATSMPTMVAPDGVLDISTVSATVAAEYRYAADHAEHFRELRCWCGCDKAFAHKSLADCFVRSDGAWEAHGAGCGICLGEAATARARLDAGDDPADIATDLDAQYGPDPTTSGA